MADVFGIEMVEDVRPGTRRNPVTGAKIVRLRTRFGMSKREFARLLGVGAASVGRWENITGAISLQARTLAAFETAEGLTKRQARRKLGNP